MNPSQTKKENEEKKKQQHKKFIDALQTYFKLKSEYENNIKKEKTKIMNKKELSWRDKRNEFLKLKHKCINCKRPVGSIFSTKLYNGEERQYIALCGDRKTPCPLDIKISLGIVHSVTTNMYDDEENIKQYKHDIIIDKNDLLFSYITAEEAVAKFDQIKEAVTETTKVYEYTLQHYLNIVDNSEKKEEVKKMQLEFYNNLDNFNTMIEQYNKTKNTQIIVDAVHLYTNTMQPRAKEIIAKKYAYTGVEYNEDDNTFHFVQIPFSIENLEWDISETGQKVLSMKTGHERFSSKKTMKNVKAITTAVSDIQPRPTPTTPSSGEHDDEDDDDDDDDDEHDEEEYEEEESDEEEEEQVKRLPKITIHPPNQ